MYFLPFLIANLVSSLSEARQHV
ncbi:hypothetical protein AGR1B_pAt30232 [Agrobacterium fabacearum S56]|nr:hypothetical protein AGR1B_pAt30232 [Agrobacterium fabacearum S56]